MPPEITEMWVTAWANIKDDYKNGRITRHQFLKEQEYMRHARMQIERTQ